MTTRSIGARRMVRWGFAGAAVTAVLAVAVVLVAMYGHAWAAAGGEASSYWHIGYYTPSPHGALSLASAKSSDKGMASLNFTDQANTALLVTQNKGQYPTMFGDLSGKTVSASFTVSGLNPGATFSYYGSFCGSDAVYVRYFFETSNAGGFDETHYWWSNPVHVDLTGNGSFTLAPVQFAGVNWSDFYGHYGNQAGFTAGFDAAVSNVTMIGLSFGGGCFFENGVATSDGSGTFTLDTFSVN